ncbi:MAG: Hsp33 family molecular chaperone HslO [Alphaproteobacteria bacterium]|nr:Hsp33 family molecular chaperone HslO [Alphaproteobacteria bacterium]
MENKFERPEGNDYVVPFVLHGTSLRGRLVRLSESVNGILTKHKYPEPVSKLLGELLVLTAMLGATLKYQGVFTMQLKSDGPVRFMVADYTSEGHLRGYVSLDEEVFNIEKNIMPDAPMDFLALLGKGYLAITVDQGEEMERYQGIVELRGRTLVDAVQEYFHRSEQLEVLLVTAIGKEMTEQKSGRRKRSWHAGGLMLQRMPEEGGNTEIRLDKKISPEDREEGWRRARILGGSVKYEELLDWTLPPDTLLYRLFHEDGVWVYNVKEVAAKCRCSRKRIASVLGSMKREEVESMKVRGKITVTCQFCNSKEIFSSEQIEKLFQA